MLITSKGQITIPARLREKKGFLPHTRIAFVEDGDAVKIVKVDKAPQRGRQIVAGLLAKKGKVKLGTDEILALTRGEP